MKTPMRLFLLLLPLLLAACGFHLRGKEDYRMPFNTLYIKAADDNSLFINELKNAVQTYNVRLANSTKQAQLTLDIVSEKQDKQIQSLSGAGRVLEYRLTYHVSLRAYDNQYREWLPPQDIDLYRSYSYDNTKVLSTEQEESLLFKDMLDDAVQQVLRRLNHAQPPQ